MRRFHMSIDMQRIKEELSGRPIRKLELLHTKGRNIVTASGRTVYLKGCNIGSWMNMEYYMYGINAVEHIFRRMAQDILGREKAEFVFTCMMDHFFQEDDVAYLSFIGTNCIRITLNYRHFEDDENPFHYKEEGFRRLDQALEWCEKYGLYAVLDLHAAQGFQNGGWHCDNEFGTALLWHDRMYKNRVIALWKELAKHYRGRAVVAGYDVLNEPDTKGQYGSVHSDPLVVPYDWDAINTFYREIVSAIRAEDPDHIIILEGDHYSVAFSGLDAPFVENLIYSSHNYSFGAINCSCYPGLSGGKYWDKEQLRKEFYEQEGTKFCEKYNVPLWVTEFGSRTYSEIFDDQASVFDEFGASWSFWQHKDIGFSSILRYDTNSVYFKTFGSITEKYTAISGYPETPERTAMRKKVAEMTKAILMSAAPDPEYATAELSSYGIGRVIDDCYYGKLLACEYLHRLKSMTLEEIDQIYQSFELSNCVEHPFVKTMRKHCVGI